MNKERILIALQKSSREMTQQDILTELGEDDLAEVNRMLLILIRSGKVTIRQGGFIIAQANSQYVEA